MFFSEYCEIFENTYFEEHLLTAIVAHLEQKSANDFFMLKKWIIDVQEMIFLCSSNDFHIQ